MPGEAMPKQTLPRLLTLSRAHFIYIAAVCLIVLPILAGIVFAPVLWMVWCDQFEMPEHERRFGFRMETFEVVSSQGGSYQVRGVGRVEPGGLFAAAGIRAGDVPRQHHGTELCGALAMASEGRSAHIDMVNIADLRAGRHDPRDITIPPLSSERRRTTR
jgi:hypothetical protein